MELRRLWRVTEETAFQGTCHVPSTELGAANTRFQTSLQTRCVLVTDKNVQSGGAIALRVPSQKALSICTQGFRMTRACVLITTNTALTKSLSLALRVTLHPGKVAEGPSLLMQKTRLRTFLCKGPGSECSRLCGPHGA